jgi:prepilin-type N-terminal cleavage/methylation domain-containing protein
MRDDGLTLLELLAALAVAAVVAGGAMLGLRDLRDRWALGAGVRQIVLDLRMARVRSIAEARPHRLLFEVPAETYRREAREDGRSYIELGRSRHLPDGVKVAGCTARDSAIGFQPRGNAASFGSVTLQGRGGAVRQVTVDMVGRIRVQ